MAPEASARGPIVRLPCGLSQNGHEIDEVEIQPLSGQVELRLEDALFRRTAPVRAATDLLASCVSFDGQPMGRELAAALTLGDREVLLRTLYALTFGRTVTTALPCGAECGAVIEFEIDVMELTCEPPQRGPAHRIPLGPKSIQIRLPTGHDLERAIAHGPRAEEHLLAICAADFDGERGQLLSLFERLDPNAECCIAATCPDCGGTNRIFLDGFELVRRALYAEGGILRQIDTLARTYGWSENQIIALPRGRRLRYLAMALEGGAG